MTRKHIIAAMVTCLAVFYMYGCSETVKPPFSDTPTSGTIHVSIDESFRPVMEAQIKMFESSNPEAHIIAHYKPEAECLKDLFRDTANRMVIVTRKLNPKEEKYFMDSVSFYPRSDGLAADAIAVLVNGGTNDTLFTMESLKQRLLGKAGRQPVVFDGLNATGTIRFAIENILQGAAFDTSIVRAKKSSSEVIDFVAATPGAIGMVGIGWIGNPEDSAQLQLLKKVKIAYVRCDKCADSPYVKPTQYSITQRRYPLVRGLYYILKENFSGLGAGFVAFMRYERGQLIFRRAYLSPEKMNFDVRNIHITEKRKKEE